MKKWCNCPKCGHKMFQYDDNGKMAVSIKCSSCKIVVNMLITEEGVTYGESKA